MSDQPQKAFLHWIHTIYVNMRRVFWYTTEPNIQSQCCREAVATFLPAFASITLHLLAEKKSESRKKSAENTQDRPSVEWVKSKFAAAESHTTSLGVLNSYLFSLCLSPFSATRLRRTHDDHRTPATTCYDLRWRSNELEHRPNKANFIPLFFVARESRSTDFHN